MWPHRRQPLRLPRPWDSPGKNTGVGCHFLLQGLKVRSESEVALSRLTLRDPTDCSLPGSSAHGIFQARVLEWGAIAFFEKMPRSDEKIVTNKFKVLPNLKLRKKYPQRTKLNGEMEVKVLSTTWLWERSLEWWWIWCYGVRGRLGVLLYSAVGL